MRNQGVILAVAISFLVIALVFIYVSQFYIPNQTEKISENLQSQYTTKGVFVVTGEDGLAAGTIITEDLFAEGTIDLQNIPSTFVPKKDNQELVYTTGTVDDSNRASYINTIVGKVVKTKIEVGAIISFASLGEGEDVVINNFEKQVQLAVENTVGNSLRTGKYVDIITKYENGEYDVVVSKKIVDSVISTGVVDSTDSTSSSSTKITDISDGVILVSLDDREYRDIELARRLGTLSVRLYKSVDQYASPVTFDYTTRATELNAKILELELNSDVEKYNEEFSMFLQGDKITVADTAELFIYMEWYSDMYYKILPSIEGIRVYQTEASAEIYRQSELEKYGVRKNIKTVTEDGVTTTNVTYVGLDGKEVDIEDVEKQNNVDLSDEALAKTITQVAEENDVTELDVIIAMVMGNETVYSIFNRLELFDSYQKENFETTTQIRKTVASQLVTTVLNYYVRYTGTNIDSLAYLIKNKFITSPAI